MGNDGNFLFVMIFNSVSGRSSAVAILAAELMLVIVFSNSNR